MQSQSSADVLKCLHHGVRRIGKREKERKRGTERQVMYVNETVNHILSTLIEREQGGGFGIAVNSQII